MKKKLALILSLLIVISVAVTPTVAYANDGLLIATRTEPYTVSDDGSYIFDSNYIFGIWQDFEERFPDRTCATEGEKAAAEYLAETLQGLGYDSKNGKYLQGFSVYTEDTVDGGYLSYSQNVVGVKKAENGSQKTVIIGAHYDNAYGLSNSLSKGAYDNGSGVAATLALAYAIAKEDIPYNVEIVFFGMEEAGMLGSSAYVSNMTEDEIENTLMMINLDSISCGDNLYIFTDEIKRTHEEMFIESAKKIGGTLTEMPWDKMSNGYFRVIDEKPFVHVGIQSDNAVFMAKGIPCTFFFGYNLSSKENINGQESDGKTDIMHTEYDTVESVLDIYGEEFVKDRFELVSSVVMTTLGREDFVEKAEHSKANPTTISFIYETWFFFVVAIIVFVAFIVAVYLIARKDWGKLPTIRIIINKRPDEPIDEIDTFEESDDGDVFE